MKTFGRLLCALALLIHATAFAANSDQSATLKSLIGEAQSHWENGATGSSREKFKEAAALINDSNWRPAQREAILYAHLRLAQIAQTPLEREDWLEIGALNFPEIEIDPSIFPPYLTVEYSRIKRRQLLDDNWSRIEKPKPPTLIDRAQKNWVYIGLGVIATGLAVSAYQDEQRRNQPPTPVHRTGF